MTHIAAPVELWRAEASKTLCSERRPDDTRRPVELLERRLQHDGSFFFFFLACQ